MLYSVSDGEQIIFPINPEKLEIRYEKSMETYEILGFGQVNIMGNPNPIRIKLSHFLPEDDSVFNTNSAITYETENGTKFIEYDYSSRKAVEILKKWAFEKTKIRLVIDEELNMECAAVSFTETVRESTSSKPCILEVLENRNPSLKTKGFFGLIKRTNTLSVPKIITMKAKDTVYSIADKYGLDYKKLALNNGIKDVNAVSEGMKLVTAGSEE